NEVAINENNNRILFEQIQSPKVQAILLGKIGKASEKKITFIIDENSSLQPLPTHIEATHLSMIIDNLIDNAFEEVLSQKKKKVRFFTLDLGDDIIFEVTDNGRGIPQEALDSIFKQGYSTKNESGRGYGLYNLYEVVEQLNGVVEVNTGE